MNDILLFYLDSVEWVNAPITVGMPQYAEGGLLASKLYVAPGDYIKHMSNYCDPCRFHPDKAICEDACPFTTCIWIFYNVSKCGLPDIHVPLFNGATSHFLGKTISMHSGKQAAQIRKTAGT